MARTANGTTDKIVNTGPAYGVVIPNYSWHFFWKGTNAPSAAKIEVTFTQAAPDAFTNLSSIYYGFAWSHTNAAFRQAAVHRFANNNTVGAVIGGGALLGGTWYAIGGSWDGTNLRVYLNGVQAGITAVNTLSTTTTPPVTTAFAAAGGVAQFAAGTLAELVVTTGVLTANEMQALAAGATNSYLRITDPVLVHEAPPGLYWPLLGDSPEPCVTLNKRPGTVTGTTIVNHPGCRSLTGFG